MTHPNCTQRQKGQSSAPSSSHCPSAPTAALSGATTPRRTGPPITVRPSGGAFHSPDRVSSSTLDVATGGGDDMSGEAPTELVEARALRLALQREYARLDRIGSRKRKADLWPRLHAATMQVMALEARLDPR